MRIRILPYPYRLGAISIGAALLCAVADTFAQSPIIINLASHDLAYSDVTKQVYASNTNSSTLTPINVTNGSVGSAISVPGLFGRLCADDSGNYIFAALYTNTPNHICQFDVNSQTVINSWTLDGVFVEDMCPVLGSPGSVMVSRKVLGGSPRFRGVVVYDNGVARPTTYSPFLGANVIEPSRSPTRYYGYDNESSPAASQILQVNASGVTQVSGWSTLQGFNYDIAWRAGWIFATSGQIFEPDRGVQVGSFSNTPVTDDAASGRYYLVSAGGIIAYDQNTLLPVGITALSGVTGAAGSLIRCGTNGFAIRVSSSKVALFRTPLVSSGPPADVMLSVLPPSLPVPTGNTLTYTLTISNQGPNTAQNVVLTQIVPPNSSYISSTSSSGTNSPTSGGLVSSPLIIPAGGVVTVTVNLQTLKAGLLASVAGITSDSLDPNLSNNVVRLEFPVGKPLASNSVAELSLQTTDIAWDKISGRIFASIPNANWLLGNSIAGLDPNTANFDTRISTPQEPAKLAVSDNGQYLYAAIGSDTSIQRVNLFSRTLDIKFPTTISGVSDMAVMPGAPQTVAATVYKTVAVYDDGVMRPNTVGPGFNPYNFGTYLAFSDTGTTAYEGLPTEFRRISIDGSGATQSYSGGLLSNSDYAIKFAAGRIYTGAGRIIDPAAQIVVTNLPFNGLVCPDPHSGKIFYLTISGSVGTLHAVDIASFVEAGSITITNISGSASTLIRWGIDGLAFRTTGNQLFLIRTAFATDNDSDNDGLPDSWELANFGTLNFSPNDDPDHDGMSNRAEFFAGTSPTNAASVLRLTSVTRQPGGILLNWQGGTNVTYYLQRSPTLGNPAVWSDIYTNPPSSLSIGSFTDLNASNAANYYRIRVPTQ